MADDTLKSLLSKANTPGSTFGELAGMYISGNRKKDNRARNILLASLFFNAKEASMQSKVMRQLEDLERNKDLQVAKLNSEFDEKLKLQATQDEIDSKGVYGYYKDSALQAFEDAHKDKLDYFNVDSKEARKAKASWMDKWSNEQYALHQKRDAQTDSSIKTLEQFSKPYMDYYTNKKRQISSPQNVSLVHNLFSKIGIGKGYEKELENKYTQSKIALEDDTSRRQRFAYAPTDRAMIDAIPESKAKAFAISPEAFNEKAAAFGLPTDLYGYAFDKWSGGNKSEASAESILLATTAQSAILSSKEEIKNIKAKFEIIKPKDTSSMSYKGWERQREKAVRDAVGMTDAKQDLIDLGNTYIDIMISTGNLTEKEREEKLSKFIKTKVGKELGDMDIAALQEQIVEGTLTRAILNVMDNDVDALNAIKTMPLDQTALNRLEQSNSNAYKLLKQYDFDVVKATQNIKESDPRVQAIRIMQEGAYYESISEAAVLSSSYLEDLLPTGGGDPLGLGRDENQEEEEATAIAGGGV